MSSEAYAVRFVGSLSRTPFSVSVGRDEVHGVESATLSNANGYLEFTFTEVVEHAEGKKRKTTFILKASPEGKAALDSGRGAESQRFPGFVELGATTSLGRAIAKFMDDFGEEEETKASERRKHLPTAAFMS